MTGPPGGEGNVGAPAADCPARTLASLLVTVTRRNDGRPIAGARVQVSGPEDRSGATDSRGRATFRGVKSGSYHANATKADHGDGEAATEAPPGGTGTANIVLDAPPISLTIMVKDRSTRHAVEGATVAISGPSSQRRQSSQEGQAQFADIAPGRYDFQVQHPNYHSARGHAVARDQGASTAEVLLTRAAALNGRVVDANTRGPIVGARVELLEANLHTTTDGSGGFNFAEVTPHRYRLQASAHGYIASTQTVDLPPEGTTVEVPLADCPAMPPITDLNKAHYAHERAHFDLELVSSELKISSEIKYIKGWSGQVVKLGNSVPHGTGGVIHGSFPWPGYRWMKSEGLGQQYWDGSAWKDLPATFELADSNNFSVGFYSVTNASGAVHYRCQYGGDWPEAFTDWDIHSAENQSKLDAWVWNIHDTWTWVFDIKRHGCPSHSPSHCRYSTAASVQFVEQNTFSAGILVIADGNIRSNDSLFFIGEPRIAMAAHEFGHHLGNPDEYAGAAVDKSLNDDGAAHGIDPDSIMGQNLTNVKKRHYRTICRHLARMVQQQRGKHYTYEPVPPL